MNKKLKLVSQNQLQLIKDENQKLTSHIASPSADRTSHFEALQLLAEQKIFIGTSGYSYDDWIGPFYPEKIKKPQMIEFYQRFFPCVELNYTYYAMPAARTLFQIRQKAPKMKFSVKAHQSITHDRDEDIQQWKSFANALEPLTETNQLSTLLFQFPYSFHRSQESLDYIFRIGEYFEQFPIMMEFRHAGWFTQSVYEMLKKNKIGICSVDAPRLKGLTNNVVLATTRQGYYRLHGRNAENWFTGDNVTRYDYTYQKSEIEEIANNIITLQNQTDEVFVYANNHPRGQAIEAAVEIAESLKGKLKI